LFVEPGTGSIRELPAMGVGPVGTTAAPLETAPALEDASSDSAPEQPLTASAAAVETQARTTGTATRATVFIKVDHSKLRACLSHAPLVSQFSRIAIFGPAKGAKARWYEVSGARIGGSRGARIALSSRGRRSACGRVPVLAFRSSVKVLVR
jgi:hypothetical protein